MMSCLGRWEWEGLLRPFKQISEKYQSQSVNIRGLSGRCWFVTPPSCRGICPPSRDNFIIVRKTWSKETTAKASGRITCWLAFYLCTPHKLWAASRDLWPRCVCMDVWICVRQTHTCKIPDVISMPSVFFLPFFFLLFGAHKEHSAGVLFHHCLEA